MVNDIFDNTILCNTCNSRMEKTQLAKNGFLLRALVCPKCQEKVIHPSDQAEYERFVDLKNKEFRVKMRLVGNSYAVSIPMEIVSFIKEQEKVMDDMVRLCFEDAGRLSLNFGNMEEGRIPRVVRAKEVRIIKNNKPVLHVKEFKDSANPQNNAKFIKRTKEDD